MINDKAVYKTAPATPGLLKSLHTGITSPSRPSLPSIQISGFASSILPIWANLLEEKKKFTKKINFIGVLLPKLKTEN